MEKCRSGCVVNSELFSATTLPLSQWLDVKVGTDWLFYVFGKVDVTTTVWSRVDRS